MRIEFGVFTLRSKRFAEVGFMVASALVRMLLVAAGLTPAPAQEVVFADKTDLQSIAVRVTNKKGDDVQGSVPAISFCRLKFQRLLNLA